MRLPTLDKRQLIRVAGLVGLVVRRCFTPIGAAVGGTGINPGESTVSDVRMLFGEESSSLLCPGLAAAILRRLYKSQNVVTSRGDIPFGEFDEVECG